MIVALAQVRSSTDKAANLRLARELIGEAKSKGASLVVFPEFLMAFSPAGQSAEELCALAEPLHGPFVSSLGEAAVRTGISIVATLYESAPARKSSRVYDTAVWIEPSGNLAAAYRKVHLYDAFGFKESDKFAPGDELASPVRAGGAAFGMMICYDLRFPEVARLLALKGADALAAPSGWVQGDLKLEHWRTMIRARALENGCYVIAPDQVGNIYIGHSMVADPLGRTLLDMDEREGVEIVELDLSLITEVRNQLPLLANRRPDVYDRMKGNE
ncbi:MAG TPA: carbon-nitrogen hydrolase family protein [candidate division Zixibacteria bacterium]|nr:carbon-nitrogen hydrolase family protein [candidate division Zixibacteria bacterium]